MWRIWWAPNNTSKWQMGFNSVFKELIYNLYEIYSCVFQHKYKLFREITQWFIHFAVTWPFLHFWYIQVTVYECNITRNVITYKPVFQTRFKRFANSLFLWEYPARLFAVSTVRINNVSVKMLLCGAIFIRLEQEHKIFLYLVFN
jgi:hypothetical protein